jgi:hypothetical protein
MPEHSGFEHTTGNGISTLEHFDKVADAVENVTPPDNELYGSIKHAFIGFRKVAKLLYPFLIYVKSQKKRCVNKFMALLNPILQAWDETFPEKNYFVKLHHIMSHLLDFVKKYEMLGRVSKESFEAVHAQNARIQRMVQSMHGDKKRIETASAKAQTKLKPNVMHSSVVIKNGVRGKKREKPRKKAEREDGIKAQVEITNHITEVEGVQYFDVLDGKGRLPLHWKDFYELVSAGP